MIHIDENAIDFQDTKIKCYTIRYRNDGSSVPWKVFFGGSALISFGSLYKAEQWCRR